MGNIKQQIEELNQSIAEINQARDKTVKYFENKIKQLEQQVNKPKIEVGKVIKVITGGKGAYGADNELGFLLQNINHDKADHGATENISFMVRLISGRIWALGFNAKIEEATKEEWETALEKEANKRGIVSGSGKNIKSIWRDTIQTLDGSGSTKWGNEGFMIDGIYVMNKTGEWATIIVEEKPVIEITHDVKFTKGVVELNLDCKTFKDGKYVLVKVG